MSLGEAWAEFCVAARETHGQPLATTCGGFWQKVWPPRELVRALCARRYERLDIISMFGYRLIMLRFGSLIMLFNLNC